VKYEIADEILKPIIAYLAGRPYRETHAAIQILSTLKEIKDGANDKQGKGSSQPKAKTASNKGTSFFRYLYA